MEDREIKFKCLEMAERLLGAMATPEKLVSLADYFFKWCTTSGIFMRSAPDNEQDKTEAA